MTGAHRQSYGCATRRLENSVATGYKEAVQQQGETAMVRKQAETTADGKRSQKPKKATAAAIALRGADAVDADLLDHVVARINAVTQAKGLETARGIAECVIDALFDGEPENFFARGKKHMSFDALKEREDLQVSYQFVWNACAVYDQLRRLPSDVAEALPLSHHKLLLPVKDAEMKRELAVTAVESKLSKEKFAEVVRRARKDAKEDSRAGRPPLPAFAKAFGKLRHIVKLSQEEEVSEASFAHFSKSEAQALLSEVQAHLRALNAIAEQVRVFAEA